ncbi:uncharacterized protein LOC129602474 [Paramacrobiotus metropolitanus]|uniref:uncharacterized protein LOC129602474 n=1 Tax=Paramacrobiotus metropolitanus TaxID=2943436 RepID=UPI002445708D|nr:uncharacterized protein LOC129602474 [Paramacrobiotus metropolitanus]
MSMLNKRLFELCVTEKINLEIILECLLLVCENGQILPPEIIDRTFDDKSAKPQLQVTLLRLACAIVQNNQPIPKAFTQKIVTDFCSGTFPNLFENPENCAKFNIITKLMNSIEVLNTAEVTAKLCEGWKIESGGDYRQRLSILLALASQANSVSAAWIDPQRLKTVFVEAMSSGDDQMIETALNGFIALSRHTSPAKAALYDDSDFRLLLEFQRSASSTGSKTNVELLIDLSVLCKLDDYEFFESHHCQVRLQKIFESDTDPKIVFAALKIVQSYPRFSRLPEKTLETIGFAKLSANNPEVSSLCENVIVADLKNGVKPTENLKAYISTDQRSESASLIYMNGVNSDKNSSKLLNADATADSLTMVLNESSQFDLDERTLAALLENNFSRFDILAEYLAGTELLMQSIPVTVAQRQRMERNIKKLCRNGVMLSDLQQLLTVCSAASATLRSFEHAVGQAHQYKLEGASFAALRQTVSLVHFESEIVAAINESEIVEAINKFPHEKAFEGKHGVKQAAHIVNEFLHNSTRVPYKWSYPPERFGKGSNESEILQLHISSIFSADLRSRFYKSDTVVSTWSARDIANWARQAVVRKTEYRPVEFVTEALAIARVALQIFKNFVLTKVQILSCLEALCALEKDTTTKGQLQQVATGSGKSAIVAVLAAVKALEGHTVDIYTSSPVLAERDAQEWAPFYQMFGLTCGHNGDKGVYVAKKKSCYDQRIVYGECAQFQFDYLRDKYSGLGTLGGRSTDFAIVDEVDSALIDDSAKLARLSTTLPEMDTLHVLYCLIWDRLLHIQSHLFSLLERQFYVEGLITRGESVSTLSYQFTNAEDELLVIRNLVKFISEASNDDLLKARIFVVDDLETFVKHHMFAHAQSILESETLGLQFPVNLQDFTRNQIPLWVESALTAVHYQENVHYIVDEGQIKPVDYLTTGVVQSSTNWNNGLHQFLQLKHSLKIHSETVTTNFLSNYSMFSKYGTNIIGFTGTLGSSFEREVMYNIYHAKLLVLPETHFKRYIQFPDICVETDEQWLKEIVITTMAETSKKRAALVICETIKTAHLIASAFSGFKVKVKLYVKNQEGQEKQIERLHPGDVVVATNLAGRGTDLKTTEIEEYGGLHVCLTFLPHSQRTEEQAFGRTSRQGNKGTGQLIIIADPHSDYRHQRDLEEKRLLEDFRDRELPYIQMKGKLFEEFCEYYNSVRQQLQGQRSFWKNMGDGVKDVAQSWFGAGSGSAPSLFETIVLLSVEEQWAKFLLMVDREKCDSKKAQAEFQIFKAELEKAESNQELIKAASNAFYFVQLGNFEYVNERHAAATEYYKLAVQIDPPFAVGAQMGLAAASLNAGDSADYKRKAVEEFNSVLSLLYKEMSVINTMQTLSQKPFSPGSASDTPLFQQLIQKANLLGYFINTI